MPIEIVPHNAAYSSAVADFNERMKQGGSKWGFYTEPLPDWIPKLSEDQKVWREYHLAVEDGTIVRGGYALKPQQWLIRGEIQIVTDWQGPFSEGAISNKWGALGLRMVRDMLKKRPLLYSWGHGGDDQPVVQMLRKMDWLMHSTPFCLRIVKPFRFLRLNRYLRTTDQRKLALDALAFSGVGSIGLRALHGAMRLRHPKLFSARATEVPRFEAWADQVWESCKGRYAAIAVRDAEAMNALLPAQGWPPVIRLRVDKGGSPIGWAVVMDNQLKDDHRFGDMRVGSIVDCLADPADAGEIVAAATRFLTARGVDIVVSNQAHPGWADGFANAGYVVLPRRRIFAASPQLRAALEPLGENLPGLHLTNMDGHGPMAL